MSEAYPVGAGFHDDTFDAPVRPYELAQARVAAMYRLPLLVAAPRILEVQPAAQPTAPLYPGSHVARVKVDCPRMDGVEGPFDLIVAHRTLDGFSTCGSVASRAPYDAALELLQWAAGLLAPHGALAGSAGNRVAQLDPRTWRSRRADRTPWLTASSCARLLGEARLARVEVSGVHPHADAPTTVLDLAPLAHRRHALGDLQRRRLKFSAAAYTLRAIWHLSGAGRHLYRDLLFWGYRS